MKSRVRRLLWKLSHSGTVPSVFFEDEDNICASAEIQQVGNSDNIDKYVSSRTDGHEMIPRFARCEESLHHQEDMSSQRPGI